MRIIFFLLGVLLTSPVFAANLYVDGGNASCSNSTTYANNTESTPWCTIGRAAWGSTNRGAAVSAQAAQAGDTVYIASGTYTFVGDGNRYNPQFSPVNSGTSGNSIVFEAVGTVTLEFSSGSGSVLGVSGYDSQLGGAKSYITFKGFTVYEVNAPGVADGGIVMIAQGTGNRIENCVFIGNVNSTLANNHSGIWLTGDTGTVIKNTKVTNFLNSGSFHWNAPGVMMYETTNSSVENNEFENCGTGVFWKGWNNTGNIVRYNIIRNSGYGVTVGDLSPNVNHKVYQNLFIDNERGGVHAVDVVDDALQGSIYVVNNTVINSAVDNDEYAAFSIVEWNAAGTIDGVYIYNNIAYRSTGSALVGMGAWNWLHWNETEIDRNVYYGVTRWKRNATNYSSLTNWRTALGGCPGTGRDCNSITSDPLFVNTSEENFKLQAESPALTLGRTITAIHGSSGQTIPAGAYINGNEVIGIDSSNGGEDPSPSISAPSGLKIHQETPNT